MAEIERASDTFDATDRKIVHALQLDGRASFSRIGAVLDVADQTVARRYRRLRDANELRVRGLTDPARLGRAQWFLHLSCSPGAAPRVGHELATRTDISWVSLTLDDAVRCVLTTPADTDQDVLRSLRHHLGVEQLDAQRLLHPYFSQTADIFTKIGGLSPHQVNALTLPQTAPCNATEPVRPLSPTDAHLLQLLRIDGRAPLALLAERTSTTRSAVQRRLAALRNSGVLVFDVDLNRHLLGLPVRTLLQAVVTPGKLHDTGTTLATHPEVAFAAASTGRANLQATLVTQDAAALYLYLTTRLAEITHINTIETIPVASTLKGSAGADGPSAETSATNDR